MAKKEKEGLDLSLGGPDTAQPDPKTTMAITPGDTLTVPPTIPISDEFEDLPPELQAELGDALSSNMEGVIPQLPLIKILHAGALSFMMPNEELVKGFEGIIVDHTPANAFWSAGFGEDAEMGNRPDCSSLNGIQSLDGKSCTQCEHNAFGSATKRDGSKARGKACKNMKRLAILLPGHSFPYRLSGPPSSIRAVDNYLTGMTDMKRPVIAYKTLFGLERGTNEDGIEFSKLMLSPVGRISADEIVQVLRMRKEWRDQIRGQGIKAEEYGAESNGTENVSSEGVPTPGDEDETPF